MTWQRCNCGGKSWCGCCVESESHGRGLSDCHRALGRSLCTSLRAQTAQLKDKTKKRIGENRVQLPILTTK